MSCRRSQVLDEYRYDPILSALGSNLSNPEIRECIKEVQKIAGYELNSSTQEAFQYINDFITNPQPDFITEWRENESQEKWYHRFTNGFLGDVQNTIACVHYHYDNLAKIEKAVIEKIEPYNYKSILGDSLLAFGNTLKWDFEYQAFVLAFRRCLDYLARAICCYYKNDFHSFRTLDKYLLKQKPQEIALALNPILSKYYSLFEFVLSEGDRKSIRDKITHYEYVSVGTINLNKNGFMLAGGGENLGFNEQTNDKGLISVLLEKTDNLDRCISEIIITFVNVIRNA